MLVLLNVRADVQNLEPAQVLVSEGPVWSVTEEALLVRIPLDPVLSG